ncbi:hypothetical protein F5Y12DRAFT_529187 [Xylaria sp. FL1777]|nr:hypothetical protein F5Y12DRAFT_529187 [Xylaria sp. FL1777]
METTHLTQGTKRRYSGEQSKRAFSQGHADIAFDGESAFLEDSVSIGVPRTSPHAMQRTRQANDEVAAVHKQSEHTQPTPKINQGTHSEDYFRSLYSAEPDFYRLGLKYPEFGAMLRGGTHLDFTDPAAVMQLTKTLLEEDFGLEINLPSDRLCPPVPNRHNYILWLKDLLDSTSPSYSQQYEPGRRVTGLDIGTGASLIYPLLGCVQRPGWRFIATDIDEVSLNSARTNARMNNLESRIHIVDRTASDPLILGLDFETIDFVMVNPPFYASNTELLELAAQKSQPPHSACTGAPVEMVCDGGEVRFVERIISESLILRDRVQWYTAMLGKQSSIEVLIDALQKHRINNFAVTTFVQGSKTRRWALAWSFLTRRPSLDVTRRYGSFVTKKMLPPITTITIYMPSTQVHTDPVPSLKKAISDAMESLNLRSWVWDEQRLRGVGFADGNVWSRAYRRRRAGKGTAINQQESAISPPDALACAFGFSVSVQSENPDESSGSSPAVVLCWLQGNDESLFESFSGVIRRCLRTDAARLV